MHEMSEAGSTTRCRGEKDETPLPSRQAHCRHPRIGNCRDTGSKDMVRISTLILDVSLVRIHLIEEAKSRTRSRNTLKNDQINNPKSQDDGQPYVVILVRIQIQKISIRHTLAHLRLGKLHRRDGNHSDGNAANRPSDPMLRPAERKELSEMSLSG